jgi:hypothetical protein
MTNQQVEDSAFAIVDALGADVLQLAPPDKKHFDPASITLTAAFFLLGAIGKGVAEGLQEWSKDKTVASLERIGNAVGRAVRDMVPRAFSADTDRESLARAGSESDAALNSAARVVDDAAVDATDQIIGVSVTASTEALQDLGLTDEAAKRIADTLRTQLTVVFTSSRRD